MYNIGKNAKTRVGLIRQGEKKTEMTHGSQTVVQLQHGRATCDDEGQRDELVEVPQTDTVWNMT